jgi:hypothetical protein
MPATRRRFLTTSATAATAGLLVGCASFGDRSGTVEKLTVELRNVTDERHTFRAAVETAGGLGEWKSREVPPGTKEPIVWEPSEGDPPVAVRGRVDGKSTQGQVFGVENADSSLCLRLVFEYGRTDEPVFLQSSDVDC